VPSGSRATVVRAVEYGGALIATSVRDRRAGAARAGRWAYSTVTVLARFRGWSTFRPRSRAIR
jgi:hypothetical protein